MNYEQLIIKTLNSALKLHIKTMQISLILHCAKKYATKKLSRKFNVKQE